jgi:aminoglycoside phosphotransferase family enzyme/predicted kinase
LSELTEEPLVRDLLDPRNLPEKAGKVELASTHASLVFLSGDSVYKVKRAKDYGFFDYRSLAARKRFCEAEVRLNRRTAPGVYLGVLPVYRDGSGFSLTRPGEVADYAVHMCRLPAEKSALLILEAGRLGHAELDRVARRVADFYRSAEELLPDPGSLQANLRENFEQVAPFIGRTVTRELFEETRAAQERWLLQVGERASRRPARDGHGDLRLDHVYLLGDEVVIIDCIEFLDRFRIADPALDVAFLAMDLRHHGRDDLSEHFLGRFAYESDDYDLYPLADGYLSYRAWVRGKVTTFLACDPQVDARTGALKAREAESYFQLAHRALLEPRAAGRLIAVGGIIGSGKTTLAGELSRRLWAPVVSGDATRKFMAGLPHEAQAEERIYGSSFTRRMQDEILRRAAVVLSSGRTVILDSTFSSPALRARARALAVSEKLPFLFVECQAPPGVVRSRLRGRTGGVSDAREGLYPLFRGVYQPADELPAAERLVADTTRPILLTVEEIESRLAPGAVSR